MNRRDSETVHSDDSTPEITEENPTTSAQGAAAPLPPPTPPSMATSSNQRGSTSGNVRKILKFRYLPNNIYHYNYERQLSQRTLNKDLTQM